MDDCKPKCQILQSLTYDQQLTATGQKEVRSFEDDDGETVLEEFIEVETIEGSNVIKGWVPADLTSHDRPTEEPILDDSKGAWFSMTPPVKTKEKSIGGFQQFCNSLIEKFSPKTIYTPNMNDVHSVSQKAQADELRAKLPLLQTTKIVEQLVGQCALDNPKELSEKDLNGPISYDTFVLPKLLNSSVPVYKKEKDQTVVVNQSPVMHVKDLDIPNLNAQKLIEIDALSRTIFAEMGKCMKDGPQYGPKYALAVARVIKNREAAVIKNPKAADEFIWEKTAIHWPGKNLSTKVASSPVQFSGWNNHTIDSVELKKARDVRRRELISRGVKPAAAAMQARQEIKEDPKTLKFYKFNKSGMLHTLCPPSRPDEPYYGGEKPYPELLAIWHNTVKIAVEATLYPEQFNKKTDSLKDVLHYTSDRSSFYGFCPFKNAVVDGKKLESSRCLNLWIDPKRSPQYCKPEKVVEQKSPKDLKPQQRSPAKSKSTTKKKPKKKK
jgi:hypothetical protein